jgi:bifunctional non-homologous end joining protein LigD
MFQDGDDLRGLPLVERKKRLKAILPKHKLIVGSDNYLGQSATIMMAGRVVHERRL